MYNISVILRDERCIEFRNINNLSQILYTHSVMPHMPSKLCTVGSSMLLYQDQSKIPPRIHWLDCNESKPKLLKGKSFTTSLQDITDMIGVRNGTDELIIGTGKQNGIHCYSTTTKSLKWSMEGQLPGMKNALYAASLGTDRRGHLFVSDGFIGNRCIQMFSVSDGRYLGCLINEGEQGFRCPHRICSHSASYSLVVAHMVSFCWSLSMINMEYWFQFFSLYFNHWNIYVTWYDHICEVRFISRTCIQVHICSKKTNIKVMFKNIYYCGDGCIWQNCTNYNWSWKQMLNQNKYTLLISSPPTTLEKISAK